MLQLRIDERRHLVKTYNYGISEVFFFNFGIHSQFSNQITHLYELNPKIDFHNFTSHIMYFLQIFFKKHFTYCLPQNTILLNSLVTLKLNYVKDKKLEK